MKKKWMLTAAAAALSIAALTGCGAAAQNTAAPVIQTEEGAAMNMITANGVGSINVEPDIAELRFGIMTQGADAKTVKDENTQRYNQVVDFLKAQGIEESKIKTNGVNMYPVYDWSNNTQTLTGYTMEMNLTVSDVAVDKVGSLLDSAVNEGINSIQSIAYMSSAFDEKYNEALKLAIENARSKAEAMAEAGGVTLGDATGISEYGANTSARRAVNNLSKGIVMEADSASGSMAVMPGTLEITANVSADFAIK